MLIEPIIEAKSIDAASQTVCIPVDWEIRKLEQEENNDPRKRN
jgi:hypothetical protein